MIKKLFKLMFYLALLVLAAGVLAYAPLTLKPPPELKTGDLVFQTSNAPQSMAILAATLSPYSHMGIVEKRGDEYYVIDSAGTVEFTKLEEWRKHGYGGRFTVYRRKDFTPEQNEKFLTAAKQYLGIKYDIFFLFDNNELYCSELPYRAYKDIGVVAGKVQRVGELEINNPFTRDLIAERSKIHPKCKDLVPEACYQTIMDQELVSPESFTEDATFERIYSNYFLGLI